MTLLTVVLAAVAAALALRTRPAVRSPVDADRLGGSLSVPATAVLAAVAAAMLGAADGTLLVLVLLGLAVGVTVAGLLSHSRRRREAELARVTVLEMCEALSAELRAGQPPVVALARCAETWPELTPVVRAARLGADVPAALRRLSERPGAAALRDLAAAWQVAQGSGAGLADALTRVADSARESQALSRVVESELASARSTVRLVAALPLLTLGLGAGLGGDPWSFLTSTPVGLSCLAGGLALALGGLWWVERIAADVSPR